MHKSHIFILDTAWLCHVCHIFSSNVGQTTWYKYVGYIVTWNEYVQHSRIDKLTCFRMLNIEDTIFLPWQKWFWGIFLNTHTHSLLVFTLYLDFIYATFFTIFFRCACSCSPLLSYADSTWPLRRFHRCRLRPDDTIASNKSTKFIWSVYVARAWNIRRLISISISLFQFHYTNNTNTYTGPFNSSMRFFIVRFRSRSWCVMTFVSFEVLTSNIFEKNI